jgi:hypothetical protein
LLLGESLNQSCQGTIRMANAIRSRRRHCL